MGTRFRQDGRDCRFQYHSSRWWVEPGVVSMEVWGLVACEVSVADVHGGVVVGQRSCVGREWDVAVGGVFRL